MLGAAYLGLACAAIGLTRFNGGVAFISVANSLLLARLLTSDTRSWSLPISTCSLAGAVATATVGLGPAAAIPMLPMNIGEAVVAALILRKADRGGGFGSSASLAWFLVAGGIVAPAVTAFGGAAVATAFGSAALDRAVSPGATCGSHARWSAVTPRSGRRRRQSTSSTRSTQFEIKEVNAPPISPVAAKIPMRSGRGLAQEAAHSRTVEPKPTRRASSSTACSSPRSSLAR